MKRDPIPFHVRYRYSDGLDGSWDGHSLKRALKVFADMSVEACTCELWTVGIGDNDEPTRIAYFNSKGTQWADPYFREAPGIGEFWNND